jgi:hypothetical protein
MKKRMVLDGTTWLIGLGNGGNTRRKRMTRMTDMRKIESRIY